MNRGYSRTMLNLIILLSACVFVSAEVELGSRHFNRQRDPYRTSYGSCSYYNKYNLPYTVYSFCVANYYLVCNPATYGDFCVTYETTCGYTARVTTVPRTYMYYYQQLQNYCTAWCSSCNAQYGTLCKATTTTSTTTTSTAATTTTTTQPTTTTTAATTTTTTQPTTTTTTSTTTTTVPTTTTTATTTTAAPTTKCEYSDYLNRTVGRVFGGSATMQCDFPSMVSLKPDFGGNAQLPAICNGVIVNTNKIVTSVECAAALSAFGGNSTATVGEYIWMVDEPQDEPLAISSIQNDTASGLASITLASPLTYNRCVAPACLASSDSTISVDKSNCKMTGWGTQSSSSGPASVLMQGNVSIASDGECASTTQLLTVLKPEIVPSSGTADLGCTSISASSSAACSGDEGGAITCAESTTGEQILVGIIRKGGCNEFGETFFTDLSKSDASTFLSSL